MIMKETGMTWREIMWKRSWINIQMMLADAPKMVYKNNEKKVTGKELAAIFKAKQSNG